MGKRLNAKIYHEAKRLGVKWILGGECGTCGGVQSYMPTWWGPVDFLEEPVSPITGTKFENAKVHKWCTFGIHRRPDSPRQVEPGSPEKRPHQTDLS